MLKHPVTDPGSHDAQPSGVCILNTSYLGLNKYFEHFNTQIQFLNF